MSERRIEPLNDAEREWVATELANARRLVDSMSPADACAELTPEVLDRAYKAARFSAGAEEAANSIINAVGMAFGQYLVDKLGFKWVAVFDDDLSEIAVVALPGRADMLVFPPNLVAKRWVSKATDFLGYVYVGIEGDLRNFEADWAKQDSQGSSASGQKPSWLGRLFGK